jgi:hypothetical protein
MKHPRSLRMSAKSIVVTRINFCGGFPHKYPAVEEFECDITNYGEECCDSGGNIKVLYSNESGSRTELIEVFPYERS